MPRLFLFLPLLTLGLLPALAATPLDGWNGYKFGMSPDAARAVPGQSFGPFSPRNLWNENKGAMGAKTTAKVNGAAYALNLFFDAAPKLNAITLENEKKSTRDDCEKSFLTLLGQLEKSYGGFVPINPERKRNDADAPPTSLEWRDAGASHYQFATVALQEEYAFVWKARKNSGGNILDVTASWSGKLDDKSQPCVTNMDYSGR